MIDFNKIAKENNLYNFHSHTEFCDGHASMAEFAEAAAQAGFSHWGFSPHSPVPISSPCNMATSDVPAYLAEAGRLRQKYAGSVNIYASMEIDYLSAEWGPSHDYFQSLPLDYRIGSVHFIPSQQGEFVDIDGSYQSFRAKMERYFHNDIKYVVNTYFDKSLEMVEAGGFNIIGHFDKISHNATHYCQGIENTFWFQQRVSELIDSIVKTGLTVEINTKSRELHGRFFPDSRHWKRLAEAGITMVINSDAHHVDLINASRDEAAELLRAATKPIIIGNAPI